MSEQTPKNQTPSKVWDSPTRLFHWAIVLLVIFQYATYEFELGGWRSMEFHSWGGYALLTLLIFRVWWGLFGSTTSRFSSFLTSPTTALHHLKSSISGTDKEPSVGHNPAGGWSVIALLLVLFAIAITGLFSSDDIFFEGPLVHLVSAQTGSLLTEIHELLFFFGLLVLVALHLLAILYYTFVRREPLVPAMIKGTRPDLPEDRAANLKFASIWKALGFLAFSAATVWTALNFL